MAKKKVDPLVVKLVDIKVVIDARKAFNAEVDRLGKATQVAMDEFQEAVGVVNEYIMEAITYINLTGNFTRGCAINVKGQDKAMYFVDTVIVSPEGGEVSATVAYANTEQHALAGLSIRSAPLADVTVV